MENTDIKIKNIKLLDNIRQRDPKENVSELMESIKQDGLMQPIGVKENSSSYTLIWGFRRLNACKKLGWKTIPATIYKGSNEVMNEEEFLILNTTENVQRANINAVELGRICEYLFKTMTHSEIAAKLSISIGRVKNCLEAWRNVPEQMRDKIKIFQAGGENREGMLSNVVTTALLRIRTSSENERLRLFEWARKNEKSAPEVHELGRLMNSGMSLDEAIAELGLWEPHAFKTITRKSEFEKYRAKYNSIDAMFKDALRSKFPGLVK